MEIDKVKLGKDLKRLRNDLGLTLEQVENETDIPKSSLSYIENGNANTDVLNKYIVLSKLYGTTLDELFGGKPTAEDTGLVSLCARIPDHKKEQVKKVLKTFLTGD